MAFVKIRVSVWRALYPNLDLVPQGGPCLELNHHALTGHVQGAHFSLFSCLTCTSWTGVSVWESRKEEWTGRENLVRKRLAEGMEMPLLTGTLCAHWYQAFAYQNIANMQMIKIG